MADTGLLVLKGERAVPAVDILAIHGLPGHRIDSWRNPGTETVDNLMWLTDLLPKHVPDARIMTFGYRQVPNGPSILSSQGLRKIALDILNRLSRKRRKHQPPIVFICHSLGGVILKRLLCIANDEPTYSWLAARTALVIYFGTPHRASKNLELNDLVSQAVFACTAELPLRRRLEATTSIFKASSDIVEDTTEEFEKLEMFYRIINVYETRSMEAVGIAVPRESATMEVEGEKIEECEADHLGICRLSSQHEPLIQVLCDAILKSSKYDTDFVDNFFKCRQLFSALYPDVSFRKSDRSSQCTLEWIGSSEAFSAWRKSESIAILHVFGAPGSGRTIFSASISSHLQQIVPQISTTLAFHFSRSDDRRQTRRDLLLSFIRQLLFKRRSPFKDAYVQQLYKSMKRSPLWSNEHLWGLLRAMLMGSTEMSTLCIVDGLEECDSTRAQILHDFKGLKDYAEASLKFLITSHLDPELTTMIGAPFSLDLEREDGFKDDRVIYVKERAKNSRIPNLTDDMISKIEGSTATFLQIDIFFSQLESQTSTATVDTINQVFENLADNLRLTTLYETAIKKICALPTKEREWSLKSLSWLLFSPRPLKIGEFAVAVAVESGARSFSELDDGHLQQIRILKERLGILVRVHGNEVHLVHHTAKEFLIKNGGDFGIDVSDLRSVYSQLFTTCITYLRFEDFKDSDSFLSKTDLKSRLEIPRAHSYAFLCYAAYYWPIFCELALDQGSHNQKENIASTAMDFLKDFIGTEWWTELYDFLRYPLSSQLPEPPDDSESGSEVSDDSASVSSKTQSELEFHFFTGPSDRWDNVLHAATYTGVTHIVEVLISQKIYTQEDQIISLGIAVETGSTSTVRLLLRSIGSSHRRKIVEFMEMACAAGSDSTIREFIILLKDHKPHNDEIPSIDKPISTLDPQQNPTQSASDGKNESHDVAVVKEENQPEEVKADPKEEQSEEIQPSEASIVVESEDDDKESQSTRVVEIEDDDGEDGNIEDDNEESILGRCLCIAAGAGHIDLVRTLVEAGADADMTLEDNSTALILAAKRGFDSIIRVLTNAKLTAEDDDSLTALHHAAANGHLAAVRAIYECFGELEARYCDKEPLHLAAEGGHVDVVRELISQGVNIEVRSRSDDYTALFSALYENQPAVFKLLLDSGADVETRDDENAPLHSVCRDDKYDGILDLLLSHGADPDVRGYKGFRPLHVAVDCNVMPAIKKLLEAGADENAVSLLTRWTPLLLAAAEGDFDTITLLLENGADVHAKLRSERAGVTALFLAADEPKVVDKLLDYDADPKIIDGCKRTILFYTAGGANLESTQKMLQLGIERSATDKFGRTALDVALKPDVWNELASDPEAEPYPDGITCSELLDGRNYDRDYECSTCDREIENEFFYHCCECSEDSEKITCMACFADGKQCQTTGHNLKTRFVGEAMTCYEELRPWVATLKTPIDNSDIVLVSRGTDPEVEISPEILDE